MDAIKAQWHKLEDKLHALQTRERALVVLSILLVFYLVWDFGFFQPMSKERADLELRLVAVKKEMVKLSAEEQVFTKVLQSDPGAAKKREVVRLEAELKSLDQNLQKLSVGLISADKLPQVLYEMLQNSNSLSFVGMQTHKPKLLNFNRGTEVEIVADQASSGQTRSAKPEVGKSKAPTEESGEPERVVGVFKHSVTVSFKGNYFDVVGYLQKLEKLDWKIYWDKFEYVVDNFPGADVTLEVFTLSTEEGLLGAKSS